MEKRRDLVFPPEIEPAQDKLKVAGALFPELTQIRRTALEQLRSEINASATNALYTRECETAHQLEQQRLTLESRLNAEGRGTE